MQPNGIRDSPLRATKTRKNRTRQASAIRSELLMTSLLRGALEPDSEFSFYLPRSVLADLSSSTGVPYDPIWLHLPSPAWTAPPTFVFRLRLPIPCWFSLAWLKTILVHRYLCGITFTLIFKGFSEIPSGFTLNVKAFRKMTSPFTLNGEGISEKAFTLDVKLTTPYTKSFLSSASQSTAGKKGKPGQAAELIRDRGSFADP
ncbi:hypothetical protein C0033_25045 [Clostridium sp. chh4-2]|nr:hypothetical protein C0033_25045 [Clostridium sp. chh4-2]